MVQNQVFGLSTSLPRMVQRIVAPLLQLPRCEQIYEHAKSIKRELFADSILHAMNVRVQTDRHEIIRIPRSGACVITANHPLGGIEGLALLSSVAAVRPDVRVLANSMLNRIPELQSHMITVNPFGGHGASQANVRALREVIEWLRAGGALIVFPAGEVSDIHLSTGRVADKPWNSAIARIIRHTNAQCIPAFVSGRNSGLFYTLGKIHPRLRTVQLAREFVNKSNSTVTLRFGTVVSAVTAASGHTDQSLIDELRRRSYVLRYKESERGSGKEIRLRLDAIADPAPAAEMQREIKLLGSQNVLCSHGDLHVYRARACDVPVCHQEIARLRELTFRYAGEGTGKESDSDRFDQWYDHIFIWNEKEKEIVGAYRAGRCDDIVSRIGVNGLYTNTLFSYSTSFIQHITPAIELGRSFIRVEYQKNHMPLLLLWRGIGEFVARHPEYRVLFGPVSISNDYSRSSKRLLLNSLMTYHYDKTIARLVKPRHPLPSSMFANWDGLLNEHTVRDVNNLNSVIRELERDAKGVPVLLKQYLRLGGTVAAFNVDQHFENCIDALIVVDLHKTGTHYIQKHAPRLMEKMEAAE